jgi:hypothetical protein
MNWLTLFTEIIAIYRQNHLKTTNTLCGQNAQLLTMKTDNTYSYHLVYRVKTKTATLQTSVTYKMQKSYIKCEQLLTCQ